MTSDSLSTLDALLDRLVDDELADPERQHLLNRLDTEADGWRRCALRFLEAQVLRRAIRDVCSGWSAASNLALQANEGAYDVPCGFDAGNRSQEMGQPARPEKAWEIAPSSHVTQSVVGAAYSDAGGEAGAMPAPAEFEVVAASGVAEWEVRATGGPAKSAVGSTAAVSEFAVRPTAVSAGAGSAGRRQWGGATWRLLAMAASFGLAFALGVSVGPWLFGPARHATPDGLQLADDQASGGMQSIEGELQPSDDVPRRPGKPDNGFVQHADGSGLRPWGKMRFVSQQPDGQPEVIEMPVYEGASLEEHLARVQQYFPQEYVEQLRQAGFEVRNQPELISLDLGDGRQLIVPSQRIEVLPARYRPMQ